MPDLSSPTDKVMQIENDYDKEVYNGDIGYVSVAGGIQSCLQFNVERASASGVEQISVQHRVMLGQHRNNHSRILRALAFVDCRGVGGNGVIRKWSRATA
jgi:hypothetical protein